MFVKFICKIFFFFLLLSVFSCIRHKNLVILDEDIKALDTTLVLNASPYKIQKKDVLNISVSTTDEASIKIFTKGIGSNSANGTSEASLYLYGYVVDDNGNVSMPIIGDLKVEDKTVHEIKILVQEKINEYYKYATVDVKLASFRITILGEVSKKGTYTVFRDQINLIEGLALSGGFTDFSKTSEVKIIRTVGERSIIRKVDFTSESLINDPWYLLKPNDIIYVEPVKVKAFKNNVTTISLALSLVSFMLVIVNFTRN